MKILQWVLIGLLALFLLIGLGGYLLPATGEVERSVTIEAPAAAVYDVVSDLQQFNDWSPWANIDPDTRFEIVGSGVGSSMSWESEDRPVGVLLAVLGYALGTYGAWFCGQLMRVVAGGS